VELSSSTLTVRQKAAAGLEPTFFKSYPLTAVVLPPNFPKNVKTQIQEKVAWFEGRKILVTDPKYSFARKRLATTSRPVRTSFMLRPDSDRQDEPPAATSSAAPAPDTAGEAAMARPQPPAAAQGLFLADSDMEELSTILRVGTPISVRQ
jgi:hypothetical protein